MTRTTALAAAAIAAAGFAAAILALPHAASAWDVYSLPAPCSISQHIYDGSTHTYSFRIVCGTDYQTFVYGTNDYPAAPTNPSFQSDLDAFVNAHYTPPATTTAPTTTATSTGASTTPTPTTTAATTTAASAPTTSTVTQTVTTTPTATAPTASFTSTATGLAVTFTDTSTAVAPATISTVTWHYGDGANGVGATSTHTFTASGDFTVVEIVTDSNGLASQASETITVSPFNGHAQFAETTSAKIATAATATFRQPLAVYCVNSWGGVKPERGYGLTVVGSHQANIWQAGCNALASKRGPVGLALLVLGHEAAHALGIKSEKTADCYSLKRIPLLEKNLGIRDRGYRAAESRYVHKKWGRC